MISRRTTHALCSTLSDWATAHRVPYAAMRDLMDRLVRISGNKSFRDSIRSLDEELAERLEPVKR